MKDETTDIATKQALLILRDRLALPNVFRTIPNPDRKWFQFWKPKRVVDPAIWRRFKGATETGTLKIRRPRTFD